MIVSDICSSLEGWAPPGFAYSWDKIGLRIGDMSAPVTRVLVTLSVTRASFDATKRAGAELIVSHHPAIWTPLKTLRTDEPWTRLYLDIAEAGVSCFGAHTNLDIAPDGVNDILARRLNLQNTRPLFAGEQGKQMKLVTFVPDSHLAKVRTAICDAGAGVINDYTHCSFSVLGTGTFIPGPEADPFSGKIGVLNEERERKIEVLLPEARLPRVLAALREAHPYEEPAYDAQLLNNTDLTIGLGRRGELSKAQKAAEFAKYVREKLQVSHVLLAGSRSGTIKTVGVLGGSGGSEIARAPHDLDAYVTGDVKYHEAEEAVMRGLTVVDAGHHGTEKYVVPAIAEYLRRRFKRLHVSQHMETNPFDVISR